MPLRMQSSCFVDQLDDIDTRIVVQCWKKPFSSITVSDRQVRGLSMMNVANELLPMYQLLTFVNRQ
jgi:hypothetical protein